MSAFSTFGRAQGPTGPPQSAPLFGNSTTTTTTSSPSPASLFPSSHRSPNTPPPRRPGVLQRMPSPGWNSSFLTPGANRGPGVTVHIRSPQGGFEGARPGGFAASTGPYRWDRESNLPYKDYDAPVDDIPPASQSLVATQDYGAETIPKRAQFQGPGNSTAFPSSRNNVFRSAGQVASRSPSDVPFDNDSYQAPQMTLSAPLVYENSRPVSHFLPSARAQRPALSSASHRRMPGFNAGVMAHKDTPSVSSNIGPYESARNPVTDVTDAHTLKRARSPLPPSTTEASKDNSYLLQNNTRTPSPPKFHASNPIGAESVPMKPINHPTNKRTRSPPRRSSDQMLQADSNIFEDDAEREMKAKERRLARFKVELEEKPQSNSVDAGPKVSTNASSLSLGPRGKSVGRQSMESSVEFPNVNVPSDSESLKSARIVGLCPDMCPLSEREERERKGDLDQYERLEGDRNQTTEFLAVKKYNRTAEREASLIRPMPILQRTMDYLLNLLYQPYNNQFLGLYNFLWDRMRAIRMDLRMQHIFNEAAITMLEQMIRFHIIAMHELCEYTKGEGFSEGFDAHLNIEQMNKASVELFQLYDDHRKKGVILPTETEFRGYYALLKLDKHPGYKVEPSELSLDLVKMTPELRQTPEVVFARDVARACRIGNFIAFFRLARKATYLQGCLMHAHFAKLRTQALASLHSGLQNNRGIPVALVAKWLGMEDEDIADILEYHGFLIKEYDEPFMVKEGPFLNSDKDYRTNSSQLVKLKRSETIIDNVLSSHAMSFPAKETKKVQHPKEEKKNIDSGNIFSTNSKLIQPVAKECFVSADIDDIGAVPSHNDNTHVEPVFETRVGQETKISHPLDSPKLFPQNFSLGHSSPTSWQTPGPKFSNSDSSVGHFSSDTQPITSSVLFPGSSSYHSSPNTHSITSPNLASNSSSEGHGFIDTQKTTNLDFSPSNFFMGLKSTEKQPPEVEIAGKRQRDDIFQDSRQIGSPYSINETHSIAIDRDIPSSGQMNYEVESFSTPCAVTSTDLDIVTHSDKTLDGYPGCENIEDMINHEVAEAKLKLIIRLWKRRSSKLKELREQRELAANAALESLSLGPPIRKSGSPPAAIGNFDIDYMMYERHEKHVRSWSKLNVQDVVSSILSIRNPGVSCLCWKAVLCSNIDSEDELRKNKGSHRSAGSWLRSKLMPERKNKDDDSDLVISIPGLSMRRRWLPSESGMDLTSCLTCVRDTKCGDLTDTLSGASGLVFLLSEDPWETQKIKLHNLLMSLPVDSCLPLLILGGYFNKDGVDPSSMVIEKLALTDIDKSRISNFLVIFLDGDHPLEHGVFFSNEQLIKGLQWLASESPPQPVLHLVNTRDLVLTHLNNSLDMSDNELGPNHCISVFNEALNQSIEKVAAAANANPSGWPFPEISLLEQEGQHILHSCLPSIGWSEPTSIEPIMGALSDCRLPLFSDDLSWLEKGSNLGHQIEKQRSLLENCLTRYLTDTSKMMGHELATKEAVIMVQKNTRLVYHNLSYYLVPQWVHIFRRIFNWLLMTLSRGQCTSVYVLSQHYIDQPASAISMRNQSRDPASLFLEQPSLDELLAAGRNPHFSGSDQLLPSASQSISEVVPECTSNETSKSCETSVDKSSLVDNVMDASYYLAHQSSEGNNGGELVTESLEVTAGIENLNKLLQKCNILQNTVGEKLSIYF